MPSIWSPFLQLNMGTNGVPDPESREKPRVTAPASVPSPVASTTLFPDVHLLFVFDMALPMLVGGADCGPINPLQGLSKELDRDRGLQQVCVSCDGGFREMMINLRLQDHFGAGRAGTSKQVCYASGMCRYSP